MKDIVIQLNKNTVRQAEDFIAAICYENHLENYLATMTVPVLNAVEQVLGKKEMCSCEESVALKCEYCQEGISFIISSADKCFFGNPADSLPTSPLSSDAVYMAQLLADEIEVLDEGKTLRMVFYVRGIDATESSRRISVLNHFYARALVVA